MDLVGSARGWIAAASLMFASGCFHEAQTGGTGGCDPGAAGCPCEAGQCDAALVCMVEIELCIPAGCDPGTELCTCYEGECFGALHCDGELCRPPDDGTSGGGSMGSSAAETVADATTASTTTSGDATEGSTITTAGTLSDDTGDATDAMTTAESSMPTTGADTGVDAGACHECISLANGMGGGCDKALMSCAPNLECAALGQCVVDALDVDDPDAIPGCCDAHPAGAPQYASVASCWETACAMECSPFTLHCGG